MELPSKIPFKIMLAPEDVAALCTITQKPHDAQSLDDMIEVMNVTAKISQIAVEVAKKIDPDDVAELQAVLDARKRSTIDDMEDDPTKSPVRGEDNANKEHLAATTAGPASNRPNKASLEVTVQYLQPGDPFSIVIHNTHIDKYWPAKIYSATPIIKIAQQLQGSEGIPIQRMRLMHKGNDLLINARSKAEPLQDDTTFGYYNVRVGDLVSLSVIAANHNVPREITSPPRQTDRLSTIQEEVDVKERPYGRTPATHKLVTKSGVEGKLRDVNEIAKRRANMAWPQQERTLRKAWSLDALRVASPATAPGASPVGLGIGGSGEQGGRREAGSPEALSYRVPDLPSPPVREGRRDSISPSMGSPVRSVRSVPSYMRPTAESRRARSAASPGQQQQQQPRNHSGR